MVPDMRIKICNMKTNIKRVCEEKKKTMISLRTANI
jgi:hypothetical protein